MQGASVAAILRKLRHAEGSGVDPGVAPPYADEAPPAASAAPYALASAARIFSLCSKPYGRLVSRPSALALARSDSICFIQYASTSSLVLCVSLPSA